jgi:hypothetical protein
VGLSCRPTRGKRAVHSKRLSVTTVAAGGKILTAKANHPRSVDRHALMLHLRHSSRHPIAHGTFYANDLSMPMDYFRLCPPRRACGEPSLSVCKAKVGLCFCCDVKHLEWVGVLRGSHSFYFLTRSPLSGLYSALLKRQSSHISAYRREAALKFPPGFDFARSVRPSLVGPGCANYHAPRRAHDQLLSALSRVATLPQEAIDRLKEEQPATLGGQGDLKSSGPLGMHSVFIFPLASLHLTSHTYVHYCFSSSQFPPPLSPGAASRIQGVTPAAIVALMQHVRKQQALDQLRERSTDV